MRWCTHFVVRQNCEQWEYISGSKFGMKGIDEFKSETAVVCIFNRVISLEQLRLVDVTS